MPCPRHPNGGVKCAACARSGGLLTELAENSDLALRVSHPFRQEEILEERVRLGILPHSAPINFPPPLRRQLSDEGRKILHEALHGEFDEMEKVEDRNVLQSSVMIILRGIPGSGKSFLASQYMSQPNAAH